MQQRLQRILARAGHASRRGAEELIASGRVRVNGRVVTELGSKADPYRDKVELDGRRLVLEEPHYVVFHKPRNVMTTLDDPEGRPTVLDYFRGFPARIFPVGRLDFATSGVLLLTNDGEFSNGMLHPRRDVPKTYAVKVAGLMTDEDLDRWRKGVVLEDGKTKQARVRLLRHEGDKTWFEITITEGRNQQIRRMGDATGFRVMRLARISFADVGHEGLRPGAWRSLKKDELVKLREAYGVPRRIRSATGGLASEAPRTRGSKRPSTAKGRPQTARKAATSKTRTETAPDRSAKSASARRGEAPKTARKAGTSTRGSEGSAGRGARGPGARAISSRSAKPSSKRGAKGARDKKR